MSKSRFPARAGSGSTNRTRAAGVAQCAFAAACALVAAFALVVMRAEAGVAAAVPAAVPGEGGSQAVGLIEVIRPATAFAPARRLSYESSQPIFPMQVEPRCVVLDNFGDPRGDRVHQGTDMLATLGQEVYAVVGGTLGRQVVVGDDGSELSGNTWRLTTTGHKTWYVYMHLAGFAPGLSNGSVVTQGQLIGYVGDTGNPGPGNYHLHFEVHPDGGAAVDPLSVLTVPSGCSVQRRRTTVIV